MRKQVAYLLSYKTKTFRASKWFKSRQKGFKKTKFVILYSFKKNTVERTFSDFSKYYYP